MDANTQLAENDWLSSNDRLPMVIYHAALEGYSNHWAERFEPRFAANGWTQDWRNGIFDYRHYPSTAHEVLEITAATTCLKWVDQAPGKPKVGKGMP